MDINIYFCGGMGCNLGAKYLRFRGKANPGFAKLNPYFIDTSSSDLDVETSPDFFYHITDENGCPLDGSGSLRIANRDYVGPQVPLILSKFQPSQNLNIVVHSTGGGSGSVIGPKIVSELMTQGLPVILLLVGGNESAIRATNTLNTLNTYENFARTRNRPLAMVYRQNSGNNIAAVNEDLDAYISVLGMVFSGQNRRVDSADLRNLLNYTTVSTHHPELTTLNLSFGEFIAPERTVAVTQLVLDDGNQPTYFSTPCDYNVHGYVHDAVKESLTAQPRSKNFPIILSVLSGEAATIHQMAVASVEAHKANNRVKLTTRINIDPNRAGDDDVFY